MRVRLTIAPPSAATRFKRRACRAFRRASFRRRSAGRSNHDASVRVRRQPAAAVRRPYAVIRLQPKKPVTLLPLQRTGNGTMRRQAPHARRASRAANRLTL